MPPDIRRFIDTLNEESRRENFPYIAATDEMIERETQLFRTKFHHDLPGTYIEICSLRDGFGTNFTTLHGLGTYWTPGSEYPAYEGILEVHDRCMLDGVGRDDFIELGNRDGVEPWGWDLGRGCFVRSDSNLRDIMGRFDTFDDMFRALFRLKAT